VTSSKKATAAPAKSTKAQAKATTPATSSRAAASRRAAAKKATPAKAAPSKSAARSTSATATKRSTKISTKTTASTEVAIAVPRDSEWTARELAQVRAQLVAQLSEMQSEYNQSLIELDELQSSSTDGAGDDQADAGSKTFEREQELSIAANRLDLLTQIKRAVERIDAGTYGYCESCGKPIPKARLKAFPMATLDVACKQREERR
jgi:RNA polymerase-binding protein DksA